MSAAPPADWSSDPRPAEPKGLVPRVTAYWRRVFSGPGPARRQALYEELASMVRAGIGLREALGSLLDHVGNRDAAFLSPLARTVDRGEPLAPAMRADPDMYTALEASLVASGERSGHLDDALRSLAQQMERRVRLRNSVIGASLYPAIVVHVGILLPTYPIIVLVMKAGAGTYWAFVLLSLTLFWGSLIGGLSYHGAQSGTAAYGRRLARLPVIGAAAKSAALARFCRAFGALHGSGCGMDVALEESGRASGNGWLRDQFLAAVGAVRTGGSLSEALAPIDGLPREMLAAIETGEKTGSLSETMARLAKLNEERLETSMERVARLLPAILILIVAIPVAIFVMWFALGYVAKIRELAG